MAKLEINIYNDPTLKAMGEQMESEQMNERERVYLGASQIGDECQRKLFYSYRSAERRYIPAKGIKAIQDGYDQEAKTIQRLRALPFIKLINEDENGEQIGFKMLNDHFRGHVDGIILGLLQAPKTWHVFEHKSVNETKFNDLKNLIEKKGEKNALIEWDKIYYTQAMIYCHALKMDRSYLVCSTPGGRDHISCRTDYNKSFALEIIAKAKYIIEDNWNIPDRLSNSREFYKCKFCEFSPICHDGKFPQIHCRTCRYSDPVEQGQYNCLLQKKIIPIDELKLACPNHVYNPALVAMELLQQQKDGCLYKHNGKMFFNCGPSGFPEMDADRMDGIYTSLQLRNDIQFVYLLDSVQDNKSMPDKKLKKAWEK